MDHDRARVLADYLQENVDPEKLKLMAEMTFKTNIIAAVVFTKSVDIGILAYYLYEDKRRTVPLEQLRTVVKEFLPKVEKEGLIVDGYPTPEAEEIAHHYFMMIGMGTVQN